MSSLQDGNILSIIAANSVVFNLFKLKCFGSVLGVACCQVFDMASAAPKKKRLSGGQTAAPKKSKTMDDYAVPAWVPEVKRAVDTLRTWMSVPE